MLSWAEHYAILIIWRKSPYHLTGILDEEISKLKSEGSDSLKKRLLISESLSCIALHQQFFLTSDQKITPSE